LEVTLTREQARRGGSATVMVPFRVACPACRGAGGVGFYRCRRCGGEGVVSGEVPASVSFPAGLVWDHAVGIPMERFGIDNLQLTVLFRPTDRR
jgi:DnaJ-class molecular chaperone